MYPPHHHAFATLHLADALLADLRLLRAHSETTGTAPEVALRQHLRELEASPAESWPLSGFLSILAQFYMRVLRQAPLDAWENTLTWSTRFLEDAVVIANDPKHGPTP